MLVCCIPRRTPVADVADCDAAAAAPVDAFVRRVLTSGAPEQASDCGALVQRRNVSGQSLARQSEQAVYFE